MFLLPLVTNYCDPPSYYNNCDSHNLSETAHYFSEPFGTHVATSRTLTIKITGEKRVGCSTRITRVHRCRFIFGSERKHLRVSPVKYFPKTGPCRWFGPPLFTLFSFFSWWKVESLPNASGPNFRSDSRVRDV